MINTTGNIGYYLFHGTRHPLGVKHMKAAMWKVDPGGEYQFSDKLAGEDVLFTLEPDLRPLRADLLSHYKGKQTVPIDEIEWHTVLRTPYRETHVRKVLTPLEQEGLIAVKRHGSRGFANGKTWISFPSR